MKLKCLEVMGRRGGGVFSFPIGELEVGTTAEPFGGSGFGRKGERRARAREGLNATQNTARRLCLQGPLLKAALLPFKTPFFAAGFEHP